MTTESKKLKTIFDKERQCNPIRTGNQSSTSSGR